MKKSFALLFNVGYWVCYTLIVYLMLNLMIRLGNPPNNNLIFQMALGFLILPAASAFYSVYFWVFPKHLKKGNWNMGLIGTTISALGSSVIGLFLMYIVMPDVKTSPTFEAFMGISIMLFCLGIVHSIMAWVVAGFVTWFSEYRLKEELKEQNHQMEMALIKSKMDPHFLFNSLNNIDSLIITNADKASEYVNILSDIIRFMLYETQQPKISLTQEVDYLKKYIAIQQLRSSNTKFVKLELPNSISSEVKIAPITFIPFVENAFKHCNNKKIEGAVSIKLALINGGIQFECTNAFNASKDIQNKQGIGNQLIEKRLRIIYGNKMDLKILQQDGLYSVKLNLSE